METVYRNGTNEVLHVSNNMHHRPAGGWEAERRDSLPFWDLCFRQYNADGIHIGAADAAVHEDIRVSTSEQPPMPGLVFVQQGEVTSTAFSGEGPRTYNASQHNFFMNPCTAQASVFKKQHLRVLMITFSPERFLQLAEHAGPVMEQLAGSVTGKPFVQKENLPITPRMQALIEEIWHCSYRGGWEHLFLQAKALELLALQCQQLETSLNKPHAMRPADADKIRQAREILLQDIQNPPSLATLARMAGLNEYKLKAGFKEVFGNTVFGYLKDHRLTLARRLILEGEKTVTEVAYETGYSTLQYFSNEFKRKFGTSPAKLG